jgi:hypothetical protein
MSRKALRQTSSDMDDCVSNVDYTSEYREYLWHSDIVIGTNVRTQADLGPGLELAAMLERWRLCTRNTGCSGTI